MRREDRRLTPDQLQSVVERCKVARVAMFDHERGIPYIIPMNFGHEWQGKTLVLYFHCAQQGRKLDILTRDNRVCFEMDCGHELVAGEYACDYGYRFMSVVGEGTVEKVGDMAGCLHALERIMLQQTGRDGWQFKEDIVKRTVVLKLTASSISGKGR